MDMDKNCHSQNSHSRLVRKCCGIILGTSSSPFLLDIVESMATGRAISFAYELSIKPLILEGDSEAVINTFNSTEGSLSSFGHIITLAKSTLVTNICISFSYIRKLGNKVSHNLTRLARHVRNLSVCLEDAPFHLYFFLFADFN